MIAVLGLVGFIIVTALVQWYISAKVWQDSDIEGLMGDADDSPTDGPAGLLPMLNGWNGL